MTWRGDAVLTVKCRVVNVEATAWNSTPAAATAEPTQRGE